MALRVEPHQIIVQCRGFQGFPVHPWLASQKLSLALCLDVQSEQNVFQASVAQQFAVIFWARVLRGMPCRAVLSESGGNLSQGARVY